MSDRQPTLAAIAQQDRTDVEHRRATINRVSATLSHQLRNPLGALRNYLYVVEHEVSRPELEELFARAHDCIERCVEVIDDIGAHASDASMRPVRVNIDAWLRQVLSDYPTPEQVSLRLDLGAVGLELELDWTRFMLAVTHLLDNACESLAAGGTIEIATRADDGGFELVVSDDGEGLPEPPVDPFEPFYTTKVGRLGLGLELVELIVRAHGGEVSLSARGDRRGTTARVRIPARRLK